MAKRSLNASSQGLARAKQAFERKGWTQEYLAAEVGLSTRQSIWKFFSGKPVERNIFVEICFILGLDWENIADLPKENCLTDLNPTDSDLNHLKEDDFILFKRQYNRLIENQCAVLQSYFEVSSPQHLDKLYTQTYFLPYLSDQQWLEVAELESSTHNCQQRRSLNPTKTELIAAKDLIKNESKIFILGKPGSGKTTFLQHLALQCQANQIFKDCVPIFLRINLLKIYDSAAPQLNLITILQQQLNNPKEFSYLLEQGKLLILLDGLDEVCQSLRDELLLNVQTFSETYHKNQIIITSRLATKLYYVRGFSYVEISEFTPEQVRSYVNNWFMAQFDHNPEAGKQKAARFLQALDLKENQGIQELTVTPIFLSFLCSIYHHKESFPSNRYKLYQTGLDILLVSWDQSKGINRDQFYEKLSVTNRIKLLSYIAEENFQKGKYFFEKLELIQTISRHLPNILTAELIPNDREELEEISQGILDSIEVQHGILVKRAKDIYSFSHLTFQEYLTARRIVNMASEDQQKSHLEKVASHLTTPEWREVILIINSLLPDATIFLTLLKNKIDNLITSSSRGRDFLEFLHRKAVSVATEAKISAVKAFYFSLFQDRNLNLAFAIDVNLANQLPTELSLDLALARMVSIAEQILTKFSWKTMLDLTQAFDVKRKYVLPKDFQDCLTHLQESLPAFSADKEVGEEWCQSMGNLWFQELKQCINAHRYFDYNWQFIKTEKELLVKYYQANVFLMECLRNPCVIDENKRNKIVDSLLILGECEEW